MKNNKNIGLIIAFAIVAIFCAIVLVDRYQTMSKYHQVVNVVDGDTIDVDINGKVERVRLIGIDTPEVVDPRQPVQCFGQEASDYVKGLLTGKKVSLEPDLSQDDRDQYGRLLRYVILENGANLNQMLIEDGYAHEYTYQVPYQYQERYQDAENSAKSLGLGLWKPGVCDLDKETIK